MTLAVTILFLATHSTALSPQQGAAPAQSTQQSETDSSNAQSAPEQSGTTPVPESKPSSVQTSTTRPKHHSARKRGSKKTPSITACDQPSANPGSAASTSPQATVNPSQPKSPQAQAPAGSPATNCPPEKIIVRQGGTAEPSIQLAGGDQAAQKRDAVKQMLGSAEANLKKIAGLQLSNTQQATVSQIRQFVDQSKAALAAGDVERGHTLAWKAQLLSADLVKPPE